MRVTTFRQTQAVAQTVQQFSEIQWPAQLKNTKSADYVKVHWGAENLRVYKASGKMTEKYDIVNAAATG